MLIADPCATMEDFKYFPKKHAIGGKSRADIRTLVECKAACKNDAACTAVDWEWVSKSFILFHPI